MSEAVDGHLASVGLAPVGAAEGVANWLGPYRTLLDPGLDLSAIDEVGSTEEPNVEAIARLGSDLIVTEVFFEGFYDTFSALAPPVLVDRPNNGAWKSAFDQAVAAVGRDAEADGVRERYRATVTETKTRAGGVEVAFVRADPDGSFRVDGGPSGFAGSVAVDAGLSMTSVPAGVGEAGESFTSQRRAPRRVDRRAHRGRRLRQAGRHRRSALAQPVVARRCRRCKPAGCCRSPEKSTTAAPTPPPQLLLEAIAQALA